MRRSRFGTAGRVSACCEFDGSRFGEVYRWVARDVQGCHGPSGKVSLVFDWVDIYFFSVGCDLLEVLLGRRLSTVLLTSTDTSGS